MKIQLALQGAGAKLFGLLAALEAIEDNGDIEVTKIAGSSAGAVAGALFAAGVPVSTMREHIARASVAEIMTPPQRNPARALLPKNLSLFTNLALGVPLANEAKFKEVLAGLLEPTRFRSMRDYWENPDEVDGENSVERTSEISGKTSVENSDEDSVENHEERCARAGIPLTIIATNANEGGKVRYANEARPIVDAVADSCGLPFIFRTANREGSDVIDGGLCDNLPVEDLDAGTPILAITFKRTPNWPKNPAQFALAVLDSAISSNVERSIRQPEVIACELEATKCGLLEWDKAQKIISEGRASADYEACYQTAKLKLQQVQATEGKRFAHLSYAADWERDSHTSSRLFRVFQAREKAREYDTLDRTLQVEAHSLEGRGDKDIATMSARIRPRTDLGSLFLSLDATAINGAMTNVTCLEEGEPPPKFELFAVTLDRSHGKEYGRLVIFREPLREGVEYSLESQFWVNSALPRLTLKKPDVERELEAGQDELISRANGNVGEMLLALSTPEDYEVSVDRMEGPGMRALPESEWGNRPVKEPKGLATRCWAASNMVKGDLARVVFSAARDD